MITGKYDRQLDRFNRSKNVRDLALRLHTFKLRDGIKQKIHGLKVPILNWVRLW